MFDWQASLQQRSSATNGVRHPPDVITFVHILVRLLVSAACLSIDVFVRKYRFVSMSTTAATAATSEGAGFDALMTLLENDVMSAAGSLMDTRQLGFVAVVVGGAFVCHVTAYVCTTMRMPLAGLTVPSFLSTPLAAVVIFYACSEARSVLHYLLSTIL